MSHSDAARWLKSLLTTSHIKHNTTHERKREKIKRKRKREKREREREKKIECEKRVWQITQIEDNED